jgi:hypothetical protein
MNIYERIGAPIFPRTDIIDIPLDTPADIPKANSINITKDISDISDIPERELLISQILATNGPDFWSQTILYQSGHLKGKYAEQYLEKLMAAAQILYPHLEGHLTAAPSQKFNQVCRIILMGYNYCSQVGTCCLEPDPNTLSADELSAYSS